MEWLEFISGRNPVFQDLPAPSLCPNLCGSIQRGNSISPFPEPFSDAFYKLHFNHHCMIPALFKINVLLVYSLRNKLPGPWRLYDYICILEEPLCHLNSSNSVALAGITDFSGRDIEKHCSKDTPLLTQLPL